MESYVGQNKTPPLGGGTPSTIKRCMPVFDAMSFGYILKTYVDLNIFKKDGLTHYQWADFHSALEFHPSHQAELHPSNNGDPFPKWMNPFAIKTPKGYSCFFVEPFHRDLVFSILPGVVDTDKYPAQVNFPFVLKDKNFEGVIPAGTPLVQVIPFKRDSWESEYGDEEDIKDAKRITNSTKTVFFDAYKKNFRDSRNFK
jgi:hypothetical protein